MSFVVFIVKPQILLPALVPRYGVPFLTVFSIVSRTLFRYSSLTNTKVFPPPVKIASAFSIAF